VTHEKICCKCKLPKDRRTDFWVKKSNPDGLNRACKECQGGYGKKHYLKNKAYYKKKASERQAVERAKIRALVEKCKSEPCKDCKVSYPPYVMDFDHVRGVKKFEIGAAVRVGAPVEAVAAEILKCEVVCSNCHRERTHQRSLVP
jgi:hypothetical protein